MQLIRKWALVERWAQQKPLRNEVAKGHSWMECAHGHLPCSLTLGRERGFNRESRVKTIMQIQETPGDER